MSMLDIQLTEDEAIIIATVLGGITLRFGIKYPRLFSGRSYKRFKLNDATADTMGHIGRRLHKHSSDGKELANKLKIPTAKRKSSARTARLARYKAFMDSAKSNGASHKEALQAWKASNE